HRHATHPPHSLRHPHPHTPPPTHTHTHTHTEKCEGRYQLQIKLSFPLIHVYWESRSCVRRCKYINGHALMKGFSHSCTCTCVCLCVYVGVCVHACLCLTICYKKCKA